MANLPFILLACGSFPLHAQLQKVIRGPVRLTYYDSNDWIRCNPKHNCISADIPEKDDTGDRSANADDKTKKSEEQDTKENEYR